MSAYLSHDANGKLQLHGHPSSSQPIPVTKPLLKVLLDSLEQPTTQAKKAVEAAIRKGKK